MSSALALASVAAVLKNPLSGASTKVANIRWDGDPRRTGRAVPPPASPDERMTMRIPVGPRFGHSLTNLFPGLEASTFEGQGSQRLPPRFNQVQISRIGWLEHKFPAWMLQSEQQHIRCSMHGQVVQDDVDPFHRARNPVFDPIEKNDPVVRRSASIRNGQRFAGRRLKGSKDVALGSAPVIDLLPGTLGWLAYLGIWLSMDHLLPQKAFRRLRSHLIQIHDDAAPWWLGVERSDEPLFFANSGSTRSPNQCSSLRHRSPSACKISLILLRLIVIPFSSLRYVSSRSRVQCPKGRTSASGLVSAVATTTEISSVLSVGGRPVLTSSKSPATPASLKRWSQLRTVFSATSSRRAIVGTRCPSLAYCPIFARSPCLAGAVRERLNGSIILRSSSVMARTCKIFGMDHLASEMLLFYHHLVDAPLRNEEIAQCVRQSHHGPAGKRRDALLQSRWQHWDQGSPNVPGTERWGKRGRLRQLHRRR